MMVVALDSALPYYLLVEPTTKWLVELHRACQQVFGNDERGAQCFVPHLSCVYASESCEELLQASISNDRSEIKSC
jgi:hypothetical protein